MTGVPVAGRDGQRLRARTPALRVLYCATCIMKRTTTTTQTRTTETTAPPCRWSSL